MPPDLRERLAAARVVPVATLDDGEQAERVAHALLRGGVACIEVTFRTPAAVEAIARAARADGMLVGAGSVLTVAQLEEAVAAGAAFAVAPSTNASVIEAARTAQVPFFPGVATPTEVERARELGADVVKAFPAGPLGGPSFLAAIHAVYPEVRFIPTGGSALRTLMPTLPRRA